MISAQQDFDSQLRHHVSRSSTWPVVETATSVLPNTQPEAVASMPSISATASNLANTSGSQHYQTNEDSPEVTYQGISQSFVLPTVGLDGSSASTRKKRLDSMFGSPKTETNIQDTAHAPSCQSDLDGALHQWPSAAELLGRYNQDLSALGIVLNNHQLTLHLLLSQVAELERMRNTTRIVWQQTNQQLLQLEMNVDKLHRSLDENAAELQDLRYEMEQMRCQGKQGCK